MVQDEQGNLRGTAAVIDKDLASAVLAKEIAADLLVISTAVEKVCLNFGKPDQKALDRMTVAEAKQYITEGHFKPGSMLPKVLPGPEGKSPHRREWIYNDFQINGPCADGGDCSIEHTRLGLFS